MLWFWSGSKLSRQKRKSEIVFLFSKWNWTLHQFLICIRQFLGTRNWGFQGEYAENNLLYFKLCCGRGRGNTVDEDRVYDVNCYLNVIERDLAYLIILESFMALLSETIVQEVNLRKM